MFTLFVYDLVGQHMFQHIKLLYMDISVSCPSMTAQWPLLFSNVLNGHNSYTIPNRELN